MMHRYVRVLLGVAAVAVFRPMHAPRAALEIVSDGVGAVRADDGAPISVLRVRVGIANHTQETLSLDVSRARLRTATSLVAPLFARAAVTSLPIVLVSRGERDVVELYFPVPAETSLSTHLAVTWPMNAPADAVADGPVSRETATRDRAASTSLRWWADPTEPWPTFEHRSGPITSRPPRRIVVAAKPTWHSSGGGDDGPPVTHECDEW